MPATLCQLIRESLQPETIIASLSSPHRVERGIAVEHLKEHLSDDGYRGTILAALQLGPQPFTATLLESLSLVEGLGALPLFDDLAGLLNLNEVEIRRQAARVIANCFSRRCGELRPWFHHEEVRFECCFAADRNTAQAMMEWQVEHQRTPNIAFGLLLTPEIVSDLVHQFPHYADTLTHKFGYTPQTQCDRDLAWLEAGSWCLPPADVECDQRWFEQRTEFFYATLLEILTGDCSGEAVEFDPRSTTDGAAFIGAVRSIDHDSFLKHRLENRFRSRSRENLRRALCKHAPFDFCHRILITAPLLEANERRIPTALQGRYLLEHAAALVTHDTNLRIERMTYLTSRWVPGPNERSAAPSRWKFPVETDADAPELKYRVLTPRQLAATRTFLEAPSPGGLATARLLQVINRQDLVGPLLAAEQDLADRFCANGIEVQIPFSRRRDSDSLAWKQALRALAIPSPRRPEYRTMVEVAFPPSRTYHAQVILVLALEQMGLFTEPVDMSLHISFSGALGDDIRYLLFAQQLITEPMIQPRPTRLSRLMSKGFAHLNYDAVPLDGIEHDGLRTELRSYRFGYHGPGHPAALQRQFIDDIVETSILVAAKQSPVPALKETWIGFTRRIEACAAEVPAVLLRLLHGDWYQATEDPDDEALARRLPISQAWLELKAWLSKEDRSVRYRQLFRDIRTQFAAEALQRLEMNTESHTFGSARTRCGAPYFDPGTEATT